MYIVGVKTSATKIYGEKNMRKLKKIVKDCIDTGTPMEWF